jgi:hypothetical protein
MILIEEQQLMDGNALEILEMIKYILTILIVIYNLKS